MSFDHLHLQPSQARGVALISKTNTGRLQEQKTADQSVDNKKKKTKRLTKPVKKKKKQLTCGALGLVRRTTSRFCQLNKV